MRYISLFSGIEAASVAFRPLGWTPAAFCETDPFACAVLAHHYPDVPNLGDVTEVDWDAADPVDLVVGGPPCQGFSVAGQRGGLADPRGNLSLAYVNALDAIDPAWSLTENVPGWLSMADNSFGHFLARLVGADAPLVPEKGQRWTDSGVVAGPKRTAAWRILDAQYFGVPQRRRRVFVVAVRGCGTWACARALFPVGQSLRGDSAPRREAGQSAAAGVPCGTVSSKWAKGTGGPAGDEHYNLIATALRARGGSHGRLDFESETFVTHALQAHRARSVTEDGTGRGTPLVAVPLDMRQISRGENEPRPNGSGGGCGVGNPGDPAYTVSGAQHAVMTLAFDPRQIHHPANHSNPKPGDPCHPLRGVANAEPAILTLAIRGRGDSHDLECRDDGIANAILTPTGGRAGVGVGAVAVAFHENQRAELTFNETASSLTVGGGKPGQGYAALQQGMSVRRLTPVECARLQGFPDSYLDILYRGKPAADGNKYKALGNSMAVPCMSWLARQIARVEDAA